jgi:hypothetical protein
MGKGAGLLTPTRAPVPSGRFRASRTIDSVAALAQLAEQPPCKRQVVGSTPTGGSHPL